MKVPSDEKFTQKTCEILDNEYSEHIEKERLRRRYNVWQ